MIKFALCKPLELRKVKLPSVVEPKFDGIRGICDLGNHQAWSRNDKPLNPGKRIWAALDELQKSIGNCWVDGEFFSGNWSNSVSDLKGEFGYKDRLKYFIFDCLTPEEVMAGRTAVLGHRQDRIPNFSPESPLVKVKGTMVQAEPEIEHAYLEYLTQGHEGAILKFWGSQYSFKRSWDWMKIKPLMHHVFQVVGAQEGTGKHVGRLGALLVKGANLTSSVGTGFSDTEREILWAQHILGQLVGKRVKVSFQDVTADRALRFPRFMGMA